MDDMNLAKKVYNGLVNIEDLVKRIREAFDAYEDECAHEAEIARERAEREVKRADETCRELTSQLYRHYALYENLHECSYQHLVERNEARKAAVFYRNALLELVKLRKNSADGIDVFMKLDEIIAKIDANKTAPVLPWEVFTQ